MGSDASASAAVEGGTSSRSRMIFVLIALILGTPAPVSAHSRTLHSLPRGTRLTDRFRNNKDALDAMALPRGRSGDGVMLDEQEDSEIIGGSKGDALAHACGSE
jgi:hypothetical protein